MTLKRTADWLASSGQLMAISPIVVHVPSLDDSMSYARYVASVTKDMRDVTLDLLHAGVGVSGEAGEVLDCIKKHWAYEQPLEREKLLLEMGDLFFYFTAMLIVLEIGLDEVVQRNVNKLDKRYPMAKYTNASATLRADTVAEKSGLTD